MAHILLCEDDLHLRQNISEMLTRVGHRVTAVSDIASALCAVREGCPDFAILDVLLPDGSGFDLCRRLRKAYPELLILLLTCCNREEDILRGFEAGADDYVEKPFRARVLMHRIAAILRRRTGDRIAVGCLTLDTKKRICLSEGRDLNLTPLEFAILAELAASPNTKVTREDLVHALWALNSPYVDENTLSVHMSRLRAKLGARSEAIVTIRGEGYMLEVDRL